jgi:hypothetical protein
MGWRERNTDGTHHLFCADLPIPLYVPKAKCARGRENRLHDVEIGVLQERKGEFVILANRH